MSCSGGQPNISSHPTTASTAAAVACHVVCPPWQPQGHAGCCHLLSPRRLAVLSPAGRVPGRAVVARCLDCWVPTQHRCSSRPHAAHCCRPALTSLQQSTGPAAARRWHAAPPVHAPALSLRADGLRAPAPPHPPHLVHLQEAKALNDGQLTAGAFIGHAFRLGLDAPSEVACARWDAASQEWVNNTALGPIRECGPPPSQPASRRAGRPGRLRMWQAPAGSAAATMPCLPVPGASARQAASPAGACAQASVRQLTVHCCPRPALCRGNGTNPAGRERVRGALPTLRAAKLGGGASPGPLLH